MTKPPLPGADVEYYHITCDCGMPSHMIQLMWFPGDSYCAQGSLSVNYQLTRKKNFWQRTWSAIRYVFGFDEQWGHWHSTSINEEDVKKLIDFLEQSVKK
jgi:hypothetical protein